MKIFETFEHSGQILYPSSASWKIIPLYFLSSKMSTLLKRSQLKWKCLRFLSAQVEFLSNALYQFWNEESIPLQILYLSSVSWKITSPYFLAKAIYTLLIRSPLKWKSLRLSSAPVKFCQVPYTNFEMASRFLFKFCISLQFHKRLFLCIFLVQRIYTLLKRIPLKWKFLRFSSAQVRFCQIPYAKFEMTGRFLSKFCIPLQFHERLFLCTFLAQAIYTLLIRSPLKWKLLRLSSAWVKIHQILHPSVSCLCIF